MQTLCSHINIVGVVTQKESCITQETLIDCPDESTIGMELQYAAASLTAAFSISENW